MTKRTAILLFVAWEGWWSYVYLSAPRPDVKMNTVGALIMGVAVPVWLALIALVVRWIKRSAKPD